MTKPLLWNKQTTMNVLVSSLDNDGLVVSSTDTILGFLAKVSQNTFDHLCQIKGRGAEKNYLIVSRSIESAMRFVQIESVSKSLLAMLSQCWPGPVTVIFKAKAELPHYLQSHEGKIAIRCPKHDGLQKLLNNFDGLFSTSVNRSGMPAAQKVEAIAEDLLTDISCIVVDDNEVAKVLPSTIIDVSSERDTGLIKVIRDGAYPIAELERLYGAQFSY